VPALPADRFHHEALLYDGLDDLVAQLVPFVRDGLRAGEPVLVALTAGKLERLRRALGDDGDAVRFLDIGVVGRNPARIIPVWRAFIDGHEGRVRGVGEPIWSERAADELVECQLHEALLNVAFDDDDGFTLVCPYDTRALDPAIVHEACCSHPIVARSAERRPSRDYRGLEAVAEPFGVALPTPPAHTEVLAFDRGSLRDVRTLIAGWAADAGLSPERTDDLVLAVHELATNSVRHGGGTGVLRAWALPGALLCEVRDQGQIGDQLVGRHVPAQHALHGRGLWLANQLCDLVQIRSLPTGTVVRLRMALA